MAEEVLTPEEAANRAGVSIDVIMKALHARALARVRLDDTTPGIPASALDIWQRGEPRTAENIPPAILERADQLQAAQAEWGGRDVEELRASAAEGRGVVQEPGDYFSLDDVAPETQE